ncbi:class I SAM-dependent methyltransferase [Phycicoccus sp.]|uniref:SAM-dependent methyltransferase n=1 Tax=Phycicoccus sp. TaxID=1902410 RepID=UPI002C5F4754|nr:class I SAM-dependent methyltransferase [Phycicoccus sp.]HMM95043.1 class I SAM-dependent methyltransferase [Phycicoccus sp.]
MDHSDISRIAHAHHPLAAPVDAVATARLLDRLSIPRDGRVVDLGCGAGEWLFALLAARPDVQAVGVDLHLHPDREERAAARGVADRVTWVTADAATWSGGRFDAALCVGASHAFGGYERMLDTLRAHVSPGARCLVGDGFWERPPGPAALTALEATPEDFPDLDGLVAHAWALGWGTAYAHVSTAAEWDDYEWSWVGSLTDWALAEGRDPAEREQALGVAAEHRQGWLRGYRHELGFVTSVLVDARR